MMKQYVLASGNQGKLRELNLILSPLGFSVTPQSQWDVPEAVEDAPTFVENALIKARQAAAHTGLAAIADDSGLVVPALRGAPGIYSARYAGEDADANSNIDKLLNELQGMTGSRRKAYFYCALVLVSSASDPAPLIATGRWHGQILNQRRGDGGFGYDPVFGISAEGNERSVLSAAELEPLHKAEISHRGVALRKLVRDLRERNG